MASAKSWPRESQIIRVSILYKDDDGVIKELYTDAGSGQGRMVYNVILRHYYNVIGRQEPPPVLCWSEETIEIEKSEK